MGILDDLKHKVEKLGDKAKEGLDDARDKAGDLLDDAKERFSSHDDERSPLLESSDVGPDTASTDAVQPGYVAAEDDVTGSDSDESSLTDDAADDADELDSGSDAAADEESFATEPAADGSGRTPAAPAGELDAEELVEQDDAATTETDGAEPADGQEPADQDAPTDRADEPAAQTAAVEKDVDPFDAPLTESIGDELAAAGIDPATVSASVDDGDRDSQP